MAWQSYGVAAPQDVLAQESSRTFMARVYRWMFVGLSVTAAAAMYVASKPELMMAVARNMLFLILAEFGVVLALTFVAHKLSGTVAGLLFLGYAGLTGVTFSVLFYIYQLGSIANAFLLTAGSFLALSIYGTVTKKDLDAWRSFLMIGLFGVVISSVVNLFLRNDALDFVTSCACVVVFAGLTAYDTQKLRRYHATSGYASAGALAVSGALMLYLDFINLFLALLRLFGRRRN